MNDSCNLKTWKNYSIRRPLRAWLDWSSILTPILYQDILIFTKDKISDHDFNGARCSSLNMVIKIGHYEHGPALTLKWKANHLHLVLSILLMGEGMSYWIIRRPVDLTIESNRTRRKKGRRRSPCMP